MKYSVAPNVAVDPHILFQGQHTASMSFRVCAKDAPLSSIDVVDTDVAFEVDWPTIVQGGETHPGEDVTFGCDAMTISALPSGGIAVATETALDDEVNLYGSPTWTWEYTVPENEPLATPVTLTMEPPDVDWVATSRNTIYLDDTEVTPQRVEEVYGDSHVNGRSAIAGSGGLCVGVGDWVIGQCGYDLAADWWPDAADDVWYLASAKKHHCYSGSLLAVQALNLVGVLASPTADASKLWPRPSWSPWGAWVSHSGPLSTCYAPTGHSHPGYWVGFRGPASPGPGAPMALHYYEGCYRVAGEGGTARFYTVFPQPAAEHDTVRALVEACFSDPRFACYAMFEGIVIDQHLDDDPAGHELTPAD